MKIKKADEMEMSINFKAMRLSWVFVSVALIIWMFYEFITTGELNTILFSIVMLQNIIYFGSKLYLTKKMSDDTDEE